MRPQTLLVKATRRMMEEKTYWKNLEDTVDGINCTTPGAAGMIVLLFEIRAFYLGTLEPEHVFMMK